MGNLPKVIEFIEQERQNENQASLFDVFASDDGHNFVTQDMELEELPEFTLKSKLTNEKQAIGYYLTASLFDEYAEITRKLEILPLSKFNTEDEDIQEIINARYAKHKPKVLIGGIINYMGSRPTKKGGKIAFIRIEDASGELEFVVFNEVFERYSQLLKIDELVFVEGEVIYDSFRDEIKVTAERILTLNEVLLDKIHTLEINLVGTDAWNQLRSMIASTETGANLVINYRNSVAKCQLRLSEIFKFQLNFERFEHLSLIVGKTGWRLGLNRL